MAQERGSGQRRGNSQRRANGHGPTDGQGPSGAAAASDQTALRVIPLGGVGEIGKNMYVFEYGEDIVVIDCGLMFPDAEMHGVDFIIPDVTYLKERRDRVRAFLITHAHEDHVGGLPYILPEFPDVPVYASTLARGMLGTKVKEHKLTRNPLLPFDPGQTVTIGAFQATAFRVGHSIPDAMGIALRTPLGTIVHTGDFKFDHTPVDGKLSDFDVLARLGSEGVLCLLSDSTRAENPGYTPSERTVGEAFREIMEPLDGRVIVATFASNIARLQQVIDAAAYLDRKVAIVGRSMEQNARIAGELGYLRYDPDQIVPKDRINSTPDGELVIATTGAQGEPMSGLARMANRDHRWVEIKPGDTVIVSASPIPGNEEGVARTVDNLFKNGANVYYHEIRRAHVSGHASQEELKLMLGLTRPKYFIPMHGEFRMLVQHGRLAAETGVDPNNILIIENGQPVEFLPGGAARRAMPVPAGYVFVDGLSVGEVGEVVLRDRRQLASDGMLLVVITVDKQSGNLVASPEIVTHGFVGGPDDPIVKGAADIVARAVDNPGDHTSEPTLLKEQVKESVSRYLYEKTRRRPLVFPVVVEV
jgi:ribonuclease J